MKQDSNFITIGNEGERQVVVQTKPNPETFTTMLGMLLDPDVRKIHVSMSAFLATEFIIVQSLALLRKSGKAITIEWTDHTPSMSAQQIIQSIIQ